MRLRIFLRSRRASFAANNGGRTDSGHGATHEIATINLVRRHSGDLSPVRYHSPRFSGATPELSCATGVKRFCTTDIAELTDCGTSGPRKCRFGLTLPRLLELTPSPDRFRIWIAYRGYGATLHRGGPAAAQTLRQRCCHCSRGSQRRPFCPCAGWRDWRRGSPTPAGSPRDFGAKRARPCRWQDHRPRRRPAAASWRPFL